MYKIKWATKRDIVGKLKDGETYKLAPPWENVETTLDDFFQRVCVDGNPYTSHLVTGSTNPEMRRRNEDFHSSSVVMVDVDGGWTINQLEQDPFYQAYGGGYYTSPSYTDEVEKFRIFFFTEKPITDPKHMRILYTELAKILHGDEKCTDPARLFYGCPDAQRADFHPEKRLPQWFIDDLIKIVEDAEARKQAYLASLHNKSRFKRTSNTQFDVEAIKPITKGGRNDKLWDIVVAMNKSGVPFHEAMENIKWVAFNRCSPPYKNTSQVESMVKRVYR